MKEEMADEEGEVEEEEEEDERAEEESTGKRKEYTLFIYSGEYIQLHKIT